MPETNATTSASSAAPQVAAATASGSSQAAVAGTAKPLELTHTFTDFDDVERTATYHFRRPSRQQISRAQSAMRKDAMVALRTLCLDCVVAEERDTLKAELEKFDGLSGTFGNEILGRVGFGELGK